MKSYFDKSLRHLGEGFKAKKKKASNLKTNEAVF